jgi:hypothetical protein
MSSPVSYDLQGQGGGVAMIAGAPSTGFRWIQCLTDCVFSTVDSDNILNSSDIVGVTIPAGVGFGGSFGTVELTSGLAICYFK